MVTMCREALQVLVDRGLVVQTKTLCEEPQQGENMLHSLEVTPLGKATFKGRGSVVSNKTCCDVYYNFIFKNTLDGSPY